MSDPLWLTSRHELLALISDAEARIAALRALQIRALAAAAVDDDTDESSPWDADKEYVREEISAALHWSAGTTTMRLLEAETLTQRLPGTLRLLSEGRISYPHAHALVDVLHRSELDDAGALELENRVLERAESQTPAELRHSARRAAAAIDPRDAEARHEAEAEQRRVSVQPVEHAMAWVNAYLPAADAQAVWLATQAVADKLPTGDGRSADQRRADAFVSVFTAVLNGGATGHGAGELPHWQGRRPSIQVSVALSTLLELDDQPGELDGYGPIPATLARRIAADPTGTWRRLITDQHGRLLHYDPRKYRPPQDLIEHVIARDRTCRAPGCNRTARRSEIDHAVPFDGTNTTPTNLHVLCPRHHHTKHEAPWDVERLPDGTTRWTTPTGRVHDKPPDTYPVDRTRRPLVPDEPPPF